MTTEQRQYIGALFLAHSKRLAEIAYRRVGDSQLAKDMAQEVFMVACCKPDVICNHPNPPAWLFSTLHKIVIRELNKSYHTEVPLPGGETPYGNEIDLKMEYCLPNELRERDKELLLLRFDSELSFAEIAERRGISEEACRKQVSRAVKRCQKLLKQQAEVF